MNKTYNSETPELNEKIYKTDKDLSNHGFGKRKKKFSNCVRVLISDLFFPKRTFMYRLN